MVNSSTFAMLKNATSIIFLGLIKCPKIMKFVLPLFYDITNLHKNFELIWTKLITYLIYAQLIN
jgi:hypothetical protein